MIAEVRAQLTHEPPVYFLLDRPPGPAGSGPYRRRAGDDGSGQTISEYEANGVGTTFVIDKAGNLASVTEEIDDRASTFSIGKNGELVYDFGEISMDNLKFDRDFEFSLVGRALEDALGLPRSPLPKPKTEPPPLEESNEIAVVQGLVVDLNGKPIQGARVSDRFDIKGESAVTTTQSGDFTFRAAEPDQIFDLVVRAPGFASRRLPLAIRNDDKRPAPDDGFVSVDNTGRIHEPLRLGAGVLVTGRVLRNGKPVAALAMGLAHVDSDQDTAPLSPLEVKTDAQGSFRIPHVPAQAEFWVYAKVDSVPDGGAVIPIRIATGEDGSTSDVGECHVEEGRRLAGRVICSDGKDVPAGTTIFASNPNAQDGFHSKLDASGKFDFKGLPPGAVRVFLHLKRSQDGSDYHASAKNRCLNPSHRVITLEGQLDHDITDLTILLEPGAEDGIGRPPYDRPDPTALADFNDAKAGPITGVPPRP